MQKILKISHVSSAMPLLETISNSQASEDCEVRSVFYNQSMNLTNQALDETDIVHIHGLSMLEDTQILELINHRLNNNKPVVFSLFSGEACNLEELGKTKTELLQNSSILFLQDTSLLSHLESFENWYWSSMPMSAAPTNVDDSLLENKKEFNLLYLDNGKSPDFEKELSAVIEKLNAEGFQFNLSTQTQTDINTLGDALKTVDILIENPASPAISYASLLAMSLGKTVLANIPEETAALTKQFEYSPILKTDAENLYYRLSSLAKQPKSLRDFGRRGVQYIESFHNPNEVCQGYLEFYRQFA